jgi:hypothetical protein
VAIVADLSSLGTGSLAPDPCNPAAFQPLTATVTVNSPTQMTVAFDPRDALVSASGVTYYVAVWNPGLTGLQKSNCGVPFELFP